MWWQRFIEWRRHRLIERVVSASVHAMLVHASQRLGRDLSAAEQADLPLLYYRWLVADDVRLLSVVAERPTRVIHLFLSELIP